MDIDDATRELRKLREGSGLSVERVAASPNLLAAFGTHDPREAHDDLVATLMGMDPTEQVLTLRVDFGLDLPDLLRRHPRARELAFLGERRATYASLVERDVKTLARWSDRAVSELRALLSADTFDGHIVVAATVQKRRLAGIEVMKFERTDDSFSHGTTVGHTNAEPGPSLPLVLFGYPPEWQPIDIRFIVAFMDQDYPTRVWTLLSDDVLAVSYGPERTELEIVDGMARCLIENPARDLLYGVWWEW